MKRKQFIKTFFVLIIVMFLPKLHVNAEEKYSYKDYSAVMEVIRDTNVRTEPCLDGEVVGEYKKGTKIEVTGICNETGWYRTDIDNKTCFLTNKNLKFVSLIYTFDKRSGVGTFDRNTNARSEPSTDGKILGEFKAGDEIVITGVCNETGWYRTFYKGETCYVTDINVTIKYGGLRILSTTETSSDSDSKASSGGSLSDGTKTTDNFGGADSDTVASQNLLTVFLVVMLFCVIVFVIFKSAGVYTPYTFIPETKPQKKKEDDSLFGIDWDGDGEVDFADDYITMDLLEDDEFF